MSDGVPNLRGGVPKWVVWLFGVALTVGMWAAPFVADLLRASSNNNLVGQMRDDIVAIKQKQAVSDAVRAGEAALQAMHNTIVDSKLDTLIAGQKKK